MMLLARMKEQAWRELLDARCSPGEFVHIGWAIAQAKSVEDVDVALIDLHELQLEHPLRAANSLDELRSENLVPA